MVKAHQSTVKVFTDSSHRCSNNKLCMDKANLFMPNSLDLSLSPARTLTTSIRSINSLRVINSHNHSHRCISNRFQYQFQQRSLSTHCLNSPSKPPRSRCHLLRLQSAHSSRNRNSPRRKRSSTRYAAR